jgi:hypothetical protein
MTNEELDKARANEAKRLWDRQDVNLPGVPVIAARLAREGWIPPEPVDPDVLAFKEWEAGKRQATVYQSSTAVAYLAGARMATEREQERAKVLVEYVEAHVRGMNVIFTHSEVLAKYRGEA